MKTNEHTYATIKRLHNQELYKVTIKRTWDTNGLFGVKTHEDIEEIPFIFTSDEVAKDFISVLPDKFEKASIKRYFCDTCHLCYSSYETYKLNIGNHEAYIKWNQTTEDKEGFFTTKYFLQPNKNEPVVESFMVDVSFEEDKNKIKAICEYKKLSELINYLKDKEKEDKKIENNNEQTFELIQNA